MPIYEYACKSCGHVFDALQKMSDNPLTDCPDCGEPELKKLLSAPNFRLKGSGWYETDFKKDNQRNLAGDAAKKNAKDGKDSKGVEKGGTAKGSESKSKDSPGKTNGGKAASSKSKD
jgi:putative FmdB family regulatory protein